MAVIIILKFYTLRPQTDYLINLKYKQKNFEIFDGKFPSTYFG